MKDIPEDASKVENPLSLQSFGDSPNAPYHRAMHILTSQYALGAATGGLSRSIRAAARLYGNPLGLELHDNPYSPNPAAVEREMADVEIARTHLTEALQAAGLSIDEQLIN